MKKKKNKKLTIILCSLLIGAGVIGGISAGLTIALKKDNKTSETKISKTKEERVSESVFSYLENFKKEQIKLSDWKWEYGVNQELEKLVKEKNYMELSNKIILNLKEQGVNLTLKPSGLKFENNTLSYSMDVQLLIDGKEYNKTIDGFSLENVNDKVLNLSNYEGVFSKKENNKSFLQLNYENSNLNFSDENNVGVELNREKTKWSELLGVEKINLRIINRQDSSKNYEESTFSEIKAEKSNYLQDNILPPKEFVEVSTLPTNLNSFEEIKNALVDSSVKLFGDENLLKYIDVNLNNSKSFVYEGVSDNVYLNYSLPYRLQWKREYLDSKIKLPELINKSFLLKYKDPELEKKNEEKSDPYFIKNSEVERFLKTQLYAFSNKYLRETLSGMRVWEWLHDIKQEIESRAVKRFEGILNDVKKNFEHPNLKPDDNTKIIYTLEKEKGYNNWIVYKVKASLDFRGQTFVKEIQGFFTFMLDDDFLIHEKNWKELSKNPLWAKIVHNREKSIPKDKSRFNITFHEEENPFTSSLGMKNYFVQIEDKESGEIIPSAKFTKEVIKEKNDNFIKLWNQNNERFNSNNPLLVDEEMENITFEILVNKYNILSDNLLNGLNLTKEEILKLFNFKLIRGNNNINFKISLNSQALKNIYIPLMNFFEIDNPIYIQKRNA